MNKWPRPAVSGGLRAFTGAVLAAALTAGQTAAQEEAAPDLWALVIESERWGVLMDRAMDGIADAPAVEESDAARADAALRDGALQLFALRRRACAAGLVDADECGALAAPDWLGAPLEPPPSPAEIAGRSEWLGAAAQPFIAAGCAAGEARTGDAMFCAVE
ncbi:MAG: hypothetical protein MI723_00915 [Caulobacterales bacterium]|nr:hypothetical protein [Caulobacterales bacterium]